MCLKRISEFLNRISLLQQVQYLLIGFSEQVLSITEITFDPQPNVVTVDVLNRLIKDNPNNMTQAIRDWMNRGRPTEAARHE